MAGWHSPSYALLWVVEQHTHDVQQAGEQLQGEVEQSDPQTCGGGGAAQAWPHGYRGEGTSPWGSAWGTPCTAIPGAHPRFTQGSMPPSILSSTSKALAGQPAVGAEWGGLPPPQHHIITQITSKEFITFPLKTSPRAPRRATLRSVSEATGRREGGGTHTSELTSGLPADS